VGCEVCCELDRLGLVGAELYGRYGDAVRSRVSVRFEDATSVNDFCVPLALFGVYAYTSKCLDRRLCRRDSGGSLWLWWVGGGWGTGKVLS